MTVTRPRPVVLSGYMGTGKSTVGAAVAHRLGREFVDVDRVIESESGMSSAELLRTEGPGAFRSQERSTIEALLESPREQGVVLAVGGGAVCDHGDATATGDLVIFQRRLAEDCTLVLLDVDPEDPRTLSVLRERVGTAAATRPLFDVDVGARLKARLADYRRAFLKVDALRPLDLVIDDVVDRVHHAEALMGEGLPPLAVRAPDVAYPVWFAPGGLHHVFDAIAAAGLQPTSALVVTSPPIEVHAAVVRQGLEAAGIRTHPLSVPAGEEQKSAATLGELWDACAAAKLGRDDVIIAVGGGVIGDMVGFCAATYMRGIAFLQVPTTLLSIVDASVGGKVAIDRPQGKNLVGAFWPPRAVVVDPAALSTLPPEELRAGLSEALKHAYLAGDDALRTALLATATEHAPPSLELLRRAVAIKRDVVEVDPFERGIRATLNLGHTFAHSLESASHFSRRHGDAVAVGLRAAAHLGHAMGHTAAELVEQLEADLRAMNLDDSATGFDAETLANKMVGDKKQARGALRLIVLKSFGQAIVVDDPGHAARVAAWRAVGAR